MKTILVDAVNTFVVKNGNAFEIFKELYGLLETFPNKKIILTNANDEEFKKFGLDKMPYEVFTLKHAPNKTDPSYYETMLKHFGLNKNDAVYFENNLEAVQSAKSVGINAYHYDPIKKDLLSIKNFLTNNI